MQDGDLIASFLKGNAAAFDVLVRRYEGPLYAFLRHMVGDGDAADDLFQDTFIRVMKALPDYTETGRFKSWLFGIARNQALDHLRRRNREQAIFYTPVREDGNESAPLDEGVEDADLQPDAITERSEWSARLEGAVAQLPDVQREVVTLRFDGDLTFRQIAEITGDSINTVQGRLRYAINALRKRLGEVMQEDLTI